MLYKVVFVLLNCIKFQPEDGFSKKLNMQLVLQTKMNFLLIKILSTVWKALAGRHYVKLAAKLCQRVGFFVFFRCKQHRDLRFYLNNVMAGKYVNKGHLHLMFDSLRLLWMVHRWHYCQTASTHRLITDTLTFTPSAIRSNVFVLVSLCWTYIYINMCMYI